METNIAVFRGKEIRKTIHKNEWWFSVADIVVALTDTVNATDYIKKMRSRDEELGKGWGQIVTPLWLDTEGGKQQVNCANTEGIFRVIQSIPTPKARTDLEQKTGKRVVTRENYLTISQGHKKLGKK